MIERAIRALRADPELYELVEHDQGYTGEAGIIVAVASVAAGFGSLFAGAGFGGFIGAIVGGLIGWFIWAGITFFIGTRIFDGTADYGEMLRVTGFATVPRIFSFVPLVGWLFGLWSLWLAVVAIRQGMDFTTGKAVGTAIIGWLITAIIAGIFSLNLL
jgi:hypothetical protein